jgi:hypothetical protein
VNLTKKQLKKIIKEEILKENADAFAQSKYALQETAKETK